MSKPVISCEFFPPKTVKGRKTLVQALDELKTIKPAFMSCTYGAGGSTQGGTVETIVSIQAKGFVAAPHLTCIGSTREKISALLKSYQDLGVDRLVALRGDLPEGMDDPGEFKHANELISFIREETGDHFHIEVAAYPEKHPEATDLAADIKNFKRKVEAGANSAITQYFFDADLYFGFVEACRRHGITVPIFPGIMPITNYKQLARFSASCGASIPSDLRKKLESFGDDLSAIRIHGQEVITKLCQTLLDGGAPGLHFYTLNRASATVEICKNLNL